MPNRNYNKINIKILIGLLIISFLAAMTASALNMLNLRLIHKKNFSDRVLLANSLIAAMIDTDEVKYYTELIRNQNEAFKIRQLQFLLDRKELNILQEAGVSEENQADIIKRMELFYKETDTFKADRYKYTIDVFKKLKEENKLDHLYVFADTGVTDEEGIKLYTYIFNAEDKEACVSLSSGGFGTVTYIADEAEEINSTKKQIPKARYYNSKPSGEFYYAVSPVLDNTGNVIALVGTALELGQMRRDISGSITLFIAAFIAYVLISILFICIFFRYSITKPLNELINTAKRIAGGDINAAIPDKASRQQSELGILARAIDDMRDVYQNMIINRVILDSSPFACIIFDENINAVDCNPKTLEYYMIDSKEDLNNKYREILASAIPEYQPNGQKSIDIAEKIKTAFKEGYCEFDTYLNLYGKLTPFNTIMKLIRYKNKTAVVTYQFDLTAQKEIQQKLVYRGELLQAVSDISDLLLTVKTEHFENTLHKAFEIMGRAVSADRVYIWRNHTGDDGKLYMSQIYEWSPDTEPQQGNELTVDISYDEAMPSWRETLLNGLCLNDLVKNLSREEQEQLTPQGIVSILIAPIFIQNKFWGFIGFDDCQNERIFTKTEENILKTLGYMIMVISDTVQNEISLNLIAAKEEALTNARSKNNFLANISHEIRTPMNAILGMTELILHESTSSTVSSHAADIKNACRSLLALINDILDFSKIESGKLEIIPIRYQTASLLVDVISIIKMKADTKNLPFVVNIDAKLPCELVGDELRVKQILINLLSNAVKFTENGSVTLTVTGEKADGRFLMKCSVSDTGIGIKPEDMEKLFESFQRVDTRKNRNIEGTGLGLSISKLLAEMMDGSISVASKYGSGSTFTAVISQEISNDMHIAAIKNPCLNTVLVYENRSIYLKSITYALNSLDCRYSVCLNQSELYECLHEYTYDYIFVSSLNAGKTQLLVSEKQLNTVIIALNGDGSMPPENGILSVSMPIYCLQVANILNNEYTSLQNRLANDTTTAAIVAPEAKVLVVDDNMVNLKVAAGLLKTYGIQADIANSGSLAIKMIKSNPYDLVFMDHMMPGMDGIDTTVAIRKINGERFKTLPVIALTANALSSAREMFIAEGLNDYLAKPIEISKLNCILTKWLPQEKQQLKNYEAIETETAGIVISGLNTQKGITQSGGSFEGYLDVLAAYIADGEKKLGELAKHYENEDIKMLTSCAHALKSASANIGAEELYALAAELELAGIREDTAYIYTNVKPFSNELSIILDNIRCYLASAEKKQAAAANVSDINFLRDTLVKIGNSLDNVDIKATEELLAVLQTYHWEEGISLLLSKIKSCIGLFDYDGAEGALSELKQYAAMS